MEKTSDKEGLAAIRNNLIQMSDDELCCVVTTDATDYTDEVLSIAREEIRRRGIDNVNASERAENRLPSSTARLVDAPVHSFVWIKRGIRVAYYFFSGSVIWLLLVFILRTCSTGEVTALPDDVEPQLNYLRASLHSGAARDMQQFFPEGYLFTNALYGLAQVEVGLHASLNSSERKRALAAARWAFRQVNSSYGKAPFLGSGPPRYGVFYLGWRNWLLAGILYLQPESKRDPAELNQFDENCRILADAFSRSETPYLSSYPGAAWPADNLVAMASLAAHDRLRAPLYKSLIGRWLASVKERLDPKTGLIPHSVDPQSGVAVQGARGSSQALMMRFLAEIDSAWAEAQYALFRQLFIDSRLGLVGVLEYPRGVEGKGDVDSGPLILGLGPSATVVAVAAARIHGDEVLVHALHGSIESVGMPFSLFRKKRYGLGLVPVADAFLAWAKATRRWSTTIKEVRSIELAYGWHRRWPLYLIVFGVLVFMWSPLLWRRRAKSKRKLTPHKLEHAKE